MKKFYSFVLMACALLLCTNAQAATLTGNTGAELQQAITAIMSSTANSGTIVLTQNVELEMDHPIWVGTKDMDGDYKSVTIDLKGHNIKLQSTADKAPTLFALTHGELILTNSSATESQIQLLGDSKNGSRIVGVFGTYRSSRWDHSDDKSLYTDSVGDHNVNTRDRGWFSHLVIDKKVKLYAGPGCLAEGVAVACQGKVTYYTNAESDSDTETLTYSTNFFPGNSWGLAQGVRVDVYGKIDIQGDDDGKVYGVTIKGTVRSSLNANSTKEGAVSSDAGDYGTYYYQYNDSIHKVSDHVTTHKLDTLDAPFIWIHPEAEVSVRNDGEKVAALYAAGYGKWLVQGTIAGKTGMYVSSGTLDLLDALVKSTANGWEASTDAGSANGGGSGVVINSRTSYSGEVDFVVGGDTKIESVKGFAIEEVVNNTTVTTPNPKHETDPSAPEYIADTKVSTITINGGTLVGGDKGAVIISTETLTATTLENPNDPTTVAVFGVTVDGNQQVTAGGTQGTIESLTTEGTHTTEVTVVDPVTGNEKTIAVVSQGDAPTGGLNWAQIESYSNENNPVDVAWEVFEASNPDEMSAGTIYLGELQINSGSENNLQQLTIPANGTLQVKHLIMNSYARIIVEAGGKLIVNGTQGISAPVVENIVLNSTATKQAIFLFNPNVSSNKYPKATVKLTSKAYKKGEDNYAWQRFAVPTHFSTDEAKILHRNDMEYDKETYPTAIYKRVYSPDGWQVLAPAANDAFEPFMCYNMTTNVSTKNPVYTFKCELAGNVNAELPIVGEKWNYYGNSYTAPIYLASMLPDLPAHISKIVYVHNGEEDKWDAVSLADAEENEMLQSRIMPMQAFVFRKQADAASSTLKYKEWIYDPAIADPELAPARHANVAKDYQRASIVMQAEEGSQEMVKLYLGSNFDNAYNDGYDVEKLMSENHFNMFIAAEEGNMARLASDNIDNIAIDMQTKEATSYTMSFKNVTLEGYAIKDNVTGTTVEIAEGNFYHFSTLANANVEGRFEVVPVAKMPTAIENTEVKANAKGIFTLTGQYLGEDFNAIPAGIYIVNGKKMVK